MHHGRTLEETVFEYIEQFQEWENGEGVGFTCDHLHRNIEHREKPTGPGSEARFVTLMRGMASLVESEHEWNGKVVFMIREQASEHMEDENSEAYEHMEDEISEETTLEQTVFDYIDRFQAREDGAGVGISCDDLNRNIVHPAKPTGPGSEARFVALMRAMPSLIESS